MSVFVCMSICVYVCMSVCMSIYIKIALCQRVSESLTVFRFKHTFLQLNGMYMYS